MSRIHSITAAQVFLWNHLVRIFTISRILTLASFSLVFIIKDLCAYDKLFKNCISGISFGGYISSYGYKAVKDSDVFTLRRYGFSVRQSLLFGTCLTCKVFCRLYLLQNQISQMFQRQQTEL